MNFLKELKDKLACLRAKPVQEPGFYARLAEAAKLAIARAVKERDDTIAVLRGQLNGAIARLTGLERYFGQAASEFLAGFENNPHRELWEAEAAERIEGGEKSLRVEMALQAARAAEEEDAQKAAA